MRGLAAARSALCSMATVPSHRDPVLEWAAGLQAVDYADAGMAQFQIKYRDLTMRKCIGSGSFGKVTGWGVGMARTPLRLLGEGQLLLWPLLRLGWQRPPGCHV